jgi:hypothetical protein
MAPADLCRTNSYGPNSYVPINCKGHASVPMILFVTDEYIDFSCICSYQFTHVCIFPGQRHEDSGELACLMYPCSKKFL